MEGGWERGATSLIICFFCLLGLKTEDFYPYGDEMGDGLVPRNDDSSIAVQLSVIFPFFDRGENNLYVSESKYFSKLNLVCIFMIGKTEW